ncbi:MAG: proline dehydrogenase [Anaerolineaceae bacterium]|jgi:proline dehydrogenase|nr:proline dehydrogenase [Anaerolineae bacterium]MBL1172745.1 proline dehydrogenase [Chloroflexota bacterium]MBW7918546.1 proline dehydrogenase family protein [Anaerolineales bacterium]MCE7904854.1 proline dehydrogenase [Anaerolineae bacterium CFX3]MDL1927100.1 proline dehydrogenase [Anaerolineae bacterium AMX1]GJQ39435.1 MAG: proline dehydrogenase [Anaerolineaceae bacterium]
MLRSFLIYLSKAQWAQNIVTGWSFAWKAASRFVAGEKTEDAVRVVRDLNAKGVNATLDHLGEHTSTADEAAQATQDILAILDEIETAGVRANVSIKLTQIGMGLDESVCRENLQRILQRAREHGNFIRIDIEDTPYTDTTLAIYQSMLERGFTNRHFGMAVQSYLYRAEADTKALLANKTTIRLVKGAYKEPPEKAFPKKADVDANYDLLTRLLIDASLADRSKLSEDGRVPPIPVIATHDEKRIEFTVSYANKVGLPKDGLEFQMLYGIRRDLQEKLAKDGYPVRVYVPFGTHWYPYFMRRLAERPANIWFFISNFFKG